MKQIDRKMFERDGVSFYAVTGNGGDTRPARQCARCGGAPNLGIFGLHESAQVCCDECGIATGKQRTKDAAIALWNRTQYKRSHGFLRSRSFWYTVGYVLFTIANAAIAVAAIFHW